MRQGLGTDRPGIEGTLNKYELYYFYQYMDSMGALQLVLQLLR